MTRAMKRCSASYMQQRYYDPLAMRFLSVDPVAASTTDGSNFNRYWYANDNPYKYTDPDGRWGIDAVIDAGYAIYDAGNFLGAAAAATVGAITGNEALTNAGLEGMAESGANLATSAAAAVIPGVSAGMLRGGAKVADTAAASKAADTASDAGRGTIYVDSKGNAIPTPVGGGIQGSPDGRYMQAVDSKGNPTGVRIDGGHKPSTHPDARSQQPHAHVPGVTNDDGTPWLPVNK